MDNDIINYRQMGLRIQFARQDRHMTRQQLAGRSGLSAPYIGRIERGDARNSLEAVARICRALDLSADYVLFGSDSRGEELAIVCDYLERHVESLRETLRKP